MSIKEHLTHNLEFYKATHEKGISTTYFTVESFVLANGRIFTSQELDEVELQQTKELPWRKHKQKDCFRNAQRTALMECDWAAFKYVEGYVSPNIPFPVLHAWLSLNGKVIDTTLRTNPEDDRERVYGTIPENWEYFGVEMPVREIFHVYEHHRTHISLLDDFLCHWPLIVRYDNQVPDPAGTSKAANR